MPEHADAAGLAEPGMAGLRSRVVAEDLLAGEQTEGARLHDDAPPLCLRADRAVALPRPGARVEVGLEADGAASAAALVGPGAGVVVVCSEAALLMGGSSRDRAGRLWTPRPREERKLGWIADRFGPQGRRWYVVQTSARLLKLLLAAAQSRRFWTGTQELARELEITDAQRPARRGPAPEPRKYTPSTRPRASAADTSSAPGRSCRRCPSRTTRPSPSPWGCARRRRDRQKGLGGRGRAR